MRRRVFRANPNLFCFQLNRPNVLLLNKDLLDDETSAGVRVYK